MNKNEQEAKRWYLQGKRDLRTAFRNRENEDYEVSCFLNQQAAEKLLKAFLYWKGERAVIGHSTFKLAKKCEEYEKEFSELFRSCQQLDLFYIPTRYPNGIPEGSPFEFFSDDNACVAQESAGKVVGIIDKYLSYLNNEEKICQNGKT